MSLFFPEWADGESTADNMRAIGGDTVDGCAVEYGIYPPEALQFSLERSRSAIHEAKFIRT